MLTTDVNQGDAHPVFRCERCGVWIPREVSDVDGPPCSYCADDLRANFRSPGMAPKMWPAFRRPPL